MWGNFVPEAIYFFVNMAKKVTSITLTPQIPAQTYNIASELPLLISLPSYTVVPVDCDPFATVGWTLNDESFARINPPNVEISTTDLSSIGTKIIMLTFTVLESVFIIIDSVAPPSASTPI